MPTQPSEAPYFESVRSYRDWSRFLRGEEYIQSVEANYKELLFKVEAAHSQAIQKLPAGADALRAAVEWYYSILEYSIYEKMNPDSLYRPRVWPVVEAENQESIDPFELDEKARKAIEEKGKVTDEQREQNRRAISEEFKNRKRKKCVEPRENGIEFIHCEWVGKPRPQYVVSTYNDDGIAYSDDGKSISIEQGVAECVVPAESPFRVEFDIGVPRGAKLIGYQCYKDMSAFLIDLAVDSIRDAMDKVEVPLKKESIEVKESMGVSVNELITHYSNTYQKEIYRLKYSGENCHRTRKRDAIVTWLKDAYPEVKRLHKKGKAGSLVYPADEAKALIGKKAKDNAKK